MLNKNVLKDYCPISLLPIFAKIFEKLIFTSMFEYFIENKLFTVCQSGFLPHDSGTSPLLSITHEIRGDVGGVFLDISKALDKV